MAEKKSELSINTSLKNMGGFVKTLIGALAAMLLGAAGSSIKGNVDASASDARIAKLEEACGKYDVRLATSETKMQGMEANVLDIKKDLAEIRATSTQILFVLRQER